MKTKVKRLAIIGLLSILPLLSAYTRSTYGPTTGSYDDIKITADKLTPTPEEDDGRIRYELTVKNIGEGYVMKSSALIYKEDSSTKMMFIPDYGDGNLFALDQFIAPNKEDSFIAVFDEEQSFDNKKFTCEAYIDPYTSVTYTGSKEVSKGENNYYYIDVTASGLTYESDNTHYDFIVTATYFEKEYLFTCQLDREYGLRFYINDSTFVYSELTVTDIVAFRYETRGYEGIDYGGFVMGGIAYALVVLLAIHAGILIFIVLPAIIIPAIVRKQKRKRLNK